MWRELDGDESAIRAAVKPAGGEWSSSKRISRPAPATESPKLAMDAGGNAVAVWNRSSNGHDNVVQAAVLAADGDWSGPEDLSASGEIAFNANVAVEAGNITAVWLEMHKRHAAVMSSSRTVAGHWMPAVEISGTVGNTFSPVVAMDDNGGAAAAWQWFDGVFLVVQAAVRSADGKWTKPETLPTPGRSTTVPKLVMDAKGNAIAGWIRFNGAWPTAQVVSRPADGDWQEPTNISNRGGKAFALGLAITRDGDAVAIWNQRTGRYSNLFSVSRPAGGSHWGARAAVSSRGLGVQASVALDADGNATVAWSGNATVLASFKPAGEPWQEDYLLSSWEDNSAQPMVTAQTSRNATAVWVALADDDDRIQSVSYDINTSAKEHEESESDDECADDDSCGDDCEDSCDDECEDACDDEGDDGEEEGEMFRGTAKADSLVGTPGNDVFYGHGGDDFIDGRGGRDVIYGGAGDDRIVGGTGRDRIFGGAGRDRIAGGPGRDIVVGGDGLDRLAGDRESDRLLGGAGPDQLSGGSGSDLLQGGPGDDVLRGNSGDDTLLAKDRRRDRAFGGSGLDLYRLDRWLDRAQSIESRY